MRNIHRMVPFRRVLRACLYILPAGVLAACGAGAASPGAPGGAAVEVLTLTSTAFEQGKSIPARYTCTGDDTSPPLAWSQPPEGTQSLALIMDDPDAPAGTWTHWVVYNLPPSAAGLDEGASSARAAAFNLPEGAVQGVTSFRRSDYGGPCPPSGTHRYFFRLYALDTTLPAGGAPLNAASLRKAIDGHVLAQGELMGVYAK